MEILGNWLLHFSLLVVLFSFFASIIAGRTGQSHWLDLARRANQAFCVTIFACSGLLVGCLVTGKFYMAYVYQYTNSTMPLFYKIAALWGGQNGSLLWWLTILCGYSLVLMIGWRKSKSVLFPYVIATIAFVQLFFVFLLLMTANPFDLIPYAAMGGFTDGRGLNPLLQNYYMIIHPPSLYLGYVGMTIPFAFGMAALITGKLDNEWVIVIRKWTLTAWFFLSLGNLLGASWAYEVLGWGGYWAWDPVENAAFMPWLTASAFLHSVIIQEKRNMLKVWNMILVLLSFLLTLTGTFLTRSGIVSSVHSFAQSNIGGYFLAILIITTVVSVGLLLYRLPQLETKNKLDSMVSRESAFLLNNLVLVGSAIAILWGTIFPVLSELVRGVKISIGPPYFNKVMIPLGLALLILTGIGPIIAWRKSSMQQIKRNFMLPTAASIVTAVLVTLLVSTKIAVVVSFSFCMFVLVTILAEYQKGVVIRMKALKENFMQALLRLISKNERRYGGYIVHLGIVLMFVGFTGSAFKMEQEFQLKPGQAQKLGDYTFRYEQTSNLSNQHKEEYQANFAVWKGKNFLDTVRPSRIFYRSQIPGEPPQPATEVSIRRSLVEDLYFALLSYEPSDQSIFVKVIVSPLVQWIWLGGLLLIIGTVVVMWPKPKAKARTLI
jgi:cytochrome c-type biogenesis protein CcmF